jgi:protein MpaA
MSNLFRVAGQSTMLTPILRYDFKRRSSSSVLILGGVHGDEPEGSCAAFGLIQEISQNPDLNCSLTVVPQLNIDGCLNKERTNSNGVDLNRNLPTKDWSPEIAKPRYHPGPYAGSEVENQILMQLIREIQPQLIVSLHSWHPVLNTNGDCLKFAELIAEQTGYKVEPSIGYPTPGCLGTYAGLERPHPVLTYEIERGLSFVEINKVHVPAIYKALKIHFQ